VFKTVERTQNHEQIDAVGTDGIRRERPALVKALFEERLIALAVETRVTWNRSSHLRSSMRTGGTEYAIGKQSASSVSSAPGAPAANTSAQCADADIPPMRRAPGLRRHYCGLIGVLDVESSLNA
jgi:hypothetical protein